jgi:hypothetical protein
MPFTKIKLILKVPNKQPNNDISDRWVKETLSYSIHYPSHPPRENTPLYNHNQKLLCEINDIPCLICGRNRKTNQAQTEAHHLMRHSSMNSIDWIEFGRKAQSIYHMQTGICIGAGFDWTEVAKNPSLFVDSPSNLLILCQEHHRGSHEGIHNLPMPDWLLQIAPKQGFQVLDK